MATIIQARPEFIPVFITLESGREVCHLVEGLRRIPESFKADVIREIERALEAILIRC